MNVDLQKLLGKLPEILKFQKENKRLPEYITIDNQKVLKKDYIDALNRMSTFTVAEDRLPYTVNMQMQVQQQNTPSTLYLSPRFRHNMDQDTNYYCGPFMDQQIIYELYGIDVKESYLAKQAGTTTSGTSHSGVIKALQDWAAANNHQVNCGFQNFSDTGWKKVAEMVADPSVGLGMHVKYKNKWGHYVYITAVDLSKKLVTIIDSLNDADLMTVSFAVFEEWIRNTTNNQPSCFVVKKIK